MPNRLGELLDAVLDALDLCEHLRLIDIALLRRDADHDDVLAAEDLFHQMRRDDVRMCLRCKELRIGVKLQDADAAHQKNGDAQNSQPDRHAVGNQPLGVTEEHTRFAFHWVSFHGFDFPNPVFV